MRPRVILWLLLTWTVTSIPSITHAVCNIVGDKAYGDCSNVTINRNPPMDISVHSSRSVSGVVGNVTVHSGGHLYLSGIASDIDIRRGGAATISGVANTIFVYGIARVSGIAGTVRVLGGAFTLEGQVDTVVGNGDIWIVKDSVIGGIPQKGHRNSKRAAVRELQSCLAFLGYDSGPIDGLSGPMTRKAVRGFQVANGLEPTGLWADINQQSRIECISNGWKPTYAAQSKQKLSGP